jgi:hypothetical protein
LDAPCGRSRLRRAFHCAPPSGPYCCNTLLTGEALAKRVASAILALHQGGSGLCPIHVS